MGRPDLTYLRRKLASLHFWHIAGGLQERKSALGPLNLISFVALPQFFHLCSSWNRNLRLLFQLGISLTIVTTNRACKVFFEFLARIVFLALATKSGDKDQFSELSDSGL